MSSSHSKFQRVLSIRDKRRGNSRNRSSASLDFNGLFTLDSNAKKPSKEEEKKIQELSQQLASLGHQKIQEARLEYVIRAKASDGDLKKALDLLFLFEDSVGGILRPHDPRIHMLGAENREKTTCYLDTVLFAMFAKVEVFEAILYNNFHDEPRNRLVTILRLWVNMLRTGKLITTDITQQLQQALADCGWADAAKIRQQDASEAFGFITDTLELPLLTLKTDIYHQGKEIEKDDHKLISERLLDVAIPDDTPQGQSVTLEKCLEEYFNNRVEVKRELHRRNTLQSIPSRGSTEKTEKAPSVHVEAVEVDSRSSSPKPVEKSTTQPKRPTPLRERALSIFSERRVELSKDTSNEGNTDGAEESLRKTSTRKEVLMPAWQFLNLIPWYTDKKTPEKQLPLASHFSSKRPMLGICLKRYYVAKNGNAARLNTHIDIPLEMAPPHFVVDNEDDENNKATGKFKLSLHSVVCHRGVSLNAGHYIALVRSPQPGRPPTAGTQSASTDPTKDTWLRFDDLGNDRVTSVDITQALEKESPYLLFYRVEPVDGKRLIDEPPPYSESKDLTFISVDQKLASLASTSRNSLDVPERRPNRASVEASRSPDSSQSAVRPGSSPSQSLRGETLLNEPVTPLDEGKSSPSMISRQTTKSGRTSMDAEKRMMVSMSKIGSRLGIDRSIRGPENDADGIADDSNATKDINTSSDASRHKEKKAKFKSIGKKGSTNFNSKKPDRECILM